MSTNSIYSFEAKTIDGQIKKFSEYENHVLLVVNTASNCGLTPQYEGLEKLYQTFKNNNFMVLAFPCNQFSNQEPGDEAQIKSFCSLNYQVSFPLFTKIDVNGSNTHPLFKYLKNQKKGFLGTEFIKWNFTKFLIDKQGNVFKRYAPNDLPETIAQDIKLLIK